MLTFPNAKINLGLNITEKCPNGYHNLETVFYPVSIEDALEVCLPGGERHGYSLRQYGLETGGDIESNLVVKAYRLLDADFGLPAVDVCLFKRIPAGAGLGGGSSDAASMLLLLNSECGLDLTTGQLEKYAARLGADCAFFIRNRPAYAEGVGEILSPVGLSLEGYGIMLVKPDISVSTREAFAQVRPCRPQHSLKEIIRLPPEEWKGYMANDFEPSIFSRFPAIGHIKQQLYHCGAVYASMSGSGSSVFGLFRPGATLPEEEVFGKGTFVFKGLLR